MEAAGKSQEAKGTEGKPASDEDLSMEEILQSIRRIIAEDDKDKKPADKNGAKGKAKDDEVPGSDVFELTDMVKEDGSVVNVKAEATKPKSASDVLMKIDEALTPETKAEPAKEEPRPEPKAPEAKAPEPKAPEAKTEEQKPLASQDAVDAVFASAAASVPPLPKAEPVATSEPDDSLLSAQAAAASIASLDRLKAAEQYVPPAPATHAPVFRDGTTVEDLVTEMLRPMMKAWLDNNLPQLVERIVEREIRKLTK